MFDFFRYTRIHISNPNPKYKLPDKKSLKIPKGDNQKTQIEERQKIQWPKEKGTKDKQCCSKHYTENLKLSNTNLINTRGWTQLLLKDKQFLLHMWHPSCYPCYHHGDKSWLRNEPVCDYDKWNNFVVSCDTNIPGPRIQFRCLGHKISTPTAIPIYQSVSSHSNPVIVIIIKDIKKNNLSVEIKFSANDAHLEHGSSGTLKAKIFESQLIKKMSFDARKPKRLNWVHQNLRVLILYLTSYVVFLRHTFV